MTTTTRTTGLVLLGFATGVTLAACARESTVPNPNHCANQTGDDWCATRYEDGSRPFCILGNGLCGTTPGRDGCVDARPAEDECYSPCGSSMTVAEDASCLPGGESTGTEGSSTTEGMTGTSETASESGSSSTTGPEPCERNQDCTELGAPFCEETSGMCVACDGMPDPDGACAEADPSLPLCVGGTCVACTPENPAACTGATPVCDEATNTCVPCTAHEQCGEAACNLFTGACLPADRVFHVGGAMADYPNLTMAVAGQGPGSETTLIVHPGMPDYNEAVAVDGGRVVAFLASNDAPTPPQWVRTSGNAPQLTVAAGATVLMDGLRLSANTSAMVPGVHANGGSAWIDRSRIVQNSGGGVVAESGAELVLRNCFVGDGTSAANALTVDGASADVVFSSLGTGFDGFDDIFAIACTAPMSVAVRNSFMVSFDNSGSEVSCPGAVIANTASETAVPGTGNVSLGDIGASWFVDVMTGDFHLNAPPVAVATTASWELGDPLTDIDGDPRPAIDGSPDHAGSDTP